MVNTSISEKSYNSFDFKMNLFYILLSMGIVNFVIGADVCEQCMSNSVYCLDDSSYYVCADGVRPFKNRLIHCEKDTFCTNSSEKVCQQKSEITGTTERVCSKRCGICPAASDTHKQFACVSREQFAVCDEAGKMSMNKLLSCDNREVCSADSYKEDGKICVPKCVMDFYKFEMTCPNKVVTTSRITVADPTTELIAHCIASGITPVGSRTHFFMRNENDLNCRTYIICEKVGKEWDARFLTCPNGGYFDDNTMKCVDYIPKSCF